MKKLPLDLCSKPKKTLPYIKKSQSIYQSPRGIIKVQLSPVLTTPDDPNEPSPDTAENLYITKFDEPIRKNIKHNSLSTPIFFQAKKLEPVHLEHKKTEEDHKDRLEYMIDTMSSIKKKTEVEIKRDPTKRNKYKDFEIFTQKKKVEEYLEYINALLSEVNELKTKNKGLLDSYTKVNQQVQDTENAFKTLQNQLKQTEVRLEQSQKDLAYKSMELIDMEEMLKKSEEKRKTANELTSSFESKMIIFQKSLIKLQKQNSDLNTDLQTAADLITSKDVLLKNNTEKIQELESHISDLLLTIKQDQQIYESTLTEHQGQINLLQFKVEKLEKENQRLMERPECPEPQEPLRRAPTQMKTVKRSETISGNKYFTEITQEEAMRWHSRYFSLEQELNLHKEQLEKLQKNESYFKTQIEQKNLMIERMEFIIKNTEKKEKEVQTDKIPVTSIPEVVSLVEILIRRAKSAEENFKCENCFRFSKKNLICEPCGHLLCEKCLEECIDMCGKCSQKTGKLIALESLKKLAEFHLTHLEELTKLNEMLKIVFN